MIFEKKHILKLKRKRIGEDRDYDSKNIFIDRNERSIDFDKEFYNKFKKKIRHINRYPNLNKIYLKLSKLLGISASNLFITDGVAGAIRNLIEIFTKPNYSNIVFFQPSFALYEVYADLFQIKKKIIKYDLKETSIVNEIFSIVDSKTAIVFLPIPDNPIAKNISKEDLKKLMSFCEKRKIILAIDEDYNDYSPPSSLNEIYKYKYIVFMRSFSKSFGAAGIRFGFMISNSFVNQYLSNYRTAYESNTLSILFAETIIENIEIKNKYVSQVNKSREKIKKILRKLNYKFYDTNFGNYILINFDSLKMKNNFIDFMLKNKIFIRGGWGHKFRKSVSITLSDIKTTNILIKYLKKFDTNNS